MKQNAKTRIAATSYSTDMTMCSVNLSVIIIIIIKPRLTRHMSVTKEDESQARLGLVGSSAESALRR